MNKIQIKYSHNAPSYQTEQAAGADIKAKLTADIIIQPLKRVIVPTGIYIEIPDGYEAQIRPRSGLAAKYGITVLNTPGTIDSDYRGEISIILINLGEDDFTICNGDRIAQMVVAPVIQGEFIKELQLNKSNRGSGGFGSTGI